MMSEELRVGKRDIDERSVGYALRIIKLYRELEKDGVDRVLGNPLLRSGTSETTACRAPYGRFPATA